MTRTVLLSARIAFVLILQTLALAVMVGMKQWTLTTGTPVLLETEPIDPRSLFRGDYVRLNYAISTVKPEHLAGDDEFDTFDEIYVVLEPGATYWEARSVHRTAPVIEEGSVFIKGAVSWTDTGVWNADVGQREAVQLVHVKYGIENYFVPEGEGKDLERQDLGPVDIQVVVDESGTAAIKGVLVDGTVRYTETFL